MGPKLHTKEAFLFAAKEKCIVWQMSKVPEFEEAYFSEPSSKVVSYKPKYGWACCKL